MKFFAAASAAVFLFRTVVALPTTGNELAVREPSAVDSEVLIKRTWPHPAYPWPKPPLLDIDLDLIVKLGKAKLIDVDLSLPIFSGYVRRQDPTDDLPTLLVDKDVITSLAKQKVEDLTSETPSVTKRGGNTFAWWYPLIDIFNRNGARSQQLHFRSK
jgi:hypothetical protein